MPPYLTDPSCRHLSSLLNFASSRHFFSSRHPPVTKPANHCWHPCSQALSWQLCSICLARSVQQAHQPLCSLAAIRPGMQSRLYHALLSTPSTTAADAPSLASLQGLLHVYKQSLDNIGKDAVEQLRHTLAPSDADELHDEDTGKHH